MTLGAWILWGVALDAAIALAVVVIVQARVQAGAES